MPSLPGQDRLGHGIVVMNVKREAVPSGIAFGERAPPAGSVDVCSLAEVTALEAWHSAFRSQRKDRRYFELVEETVCPEFTYRYFVIKDDQGRIRAVQPFFLLDQDLLTGAGPRLTALAGQVRRLWPRFLKMRTLMAGCSAGEGHLHASSSASQRRDAEILAANITRLARKERASLIVLKEFPDLYREALSCFLPHGFTRIPSMPMTRLELSGYANFEDYLAKTFKSKRRNEFRRKFKAAEQLGPIALEILADASALAEEIYPLYLQVYERSNLHFEKLTKEFFREVGRRMPDKVRFFIWRQDGRIIAFSLCLLGEDTLYGEYLGLDYSIALQLHLYFYVMRDTISWAIANGYTSIVSSALGYAPKLQMRHVLEPLDLYVRHASPAVNAVMKHILPWLEPTRGEEILKQFPNYGDLWG
jgi:predicted N-acyltransferase